MSSARPAAQPRKAAHSTSWSIDRAGDRTGAPQAATNPPAESEHLQSTLLEGDATTWLSLRTDESVHTRPVFAAWTGSSFAVASQAYAVKTRYPERGAACSLGTDLGDTHLVVESIPARLTDAENFEQASRAFAAVFDWPTTVAGDGLDAPYAARPLVVRPSGSTS